MSREIREFDDSVAWIFPLMTAASVLCRARRPEYGRMPGKRRGEWKGRQRSEARQGIDGRHASSSLTLSRARASLCTT